jgi:hypothetical protein
MTTTTAQDSTHPETCPGCLECGAYHYRIVRHYQRGSRRTIMTGLNLLQAQAHCSDPETSSSTCTTSAGKARTRRMGAWFDGYTDR